MLISINKVKIGDRIRESYGDIEELAKDIEENGLINPPVVTPDFELIAGERRLRAMKRLGYEQIEVRVMKVDDYEHMLNLEINENENRKDFTKLERLEYARRLERIERVKAKERMDNPSQNFGQVGRTDDIVSEKIGIGSGEQYRKEKFVAENADKETLEQWDKGDISTHKAYSKIKALEKQIEELRSQEPKVIEVEKEVYPSDYLDKQKRIEELQEELRNQIDPIEYERLRKELTDKNLELYDIKQQMEKEKVTIEESKDVHLKKLKDTAIVFSNRVHSFINDVGGLGWLIEYLDEIPSYEQEEYIKAIELLDRWVTTIKSNL